MEGVSFGYEAAEPSVPIQQEDIQLSLDVLAQGNKARFNAKGKRVRALEQDQQTKHWIKS